MGNTSDSWHRWSRIRSADMKTRLQAVVSAWEAYIVDTSQSWMCSHMQYMVMPLPLVVSVSEDYIVDTSQSWRCNHRQYMVMPLQLVVSTVGEMGKMVMERYIREPCATEQM